MKYQTFFYLTEGLHCTCIFVHAFSAPPSVHLCMRCVRALWFCASSRNVVAYRSRFTRVENVNANEKRVCRCTLLGFFYRATQAQLVCIARCVRAGFSWWETWGRTAGEACGLNGSSWFSRQSGVRIGCRSSEIGQFVAAAPCSGYKSATVIVDGLGYRERKRAEN